MRWLIFSVLLLLSGCFRVRGIDLTDGGLPDLGPPLMPTHLANANPDAGTCNLTIPPPSPNIPTFDTIQGRLNGMPLPSGCVFQEEQQQTSSTPPLQFTVAVLIVRNLMIPSGTALRITGSRPLAIVARERIQIDGMLDGSAALNSPGPGGLLVEPGVGQPGMSSNGADSGGGGGSYGTLGTSGADAKVAGDAANGGVNGARYNDTSLSISVEAGSAGGTGGGVDGSVPCGLGGGGGGALQLTAGYVLRVTGQVLVNGGGGLGGCYNSSSAQGQGGGGGGSGGGLYLESRILELTSTAILAANGGGGGGGRGDLTQTQQRNDGQDGQVSATPAPGGNQSSTSGGPGGAGAAGSTAATSGMNNFPNGGGGGGGVGRIVLRAQTMSTAGSIVSPPANSITF